MLLQLLILLYPANSNSFAPYSPLHQQELILRAKTQSQVASSSVESEVLGQVSRIRYSGDDDESFLRAEAVPTFACHGTGNFQGLENVRSAGLEGVLRQGPAFVVENILSHETCENLIHLCEEDLGFGSYKKGKNNHGAMQIVVSQVVADQLSQALSRHVDVDEVNSRRIETEGLDVEQDVRLVYAGINRRWRVYRYEPGGEETFAPHIDAGFPPSGLSQDSTQLVWDASETMGEEGIVARLTVLMYLNNDFVGGETKFYQPLGETNGEFRLICAVRPMAGSILVFPQAVGEDAVEHARVHWPLHEGSPVQSGKRPKYVVRSDILFAKKKEQIQLDDPYTKHDHVVRNTFRQRSQAFNSGFLNHLASLYNPHMGVENLGPLLYSFIRFTKVKSVLEIGAGYTSLWIMQALKDNDDEMERICALGRSGKCLLLDIPWADPTTVEGYHNQKSSLLFVDNCRHQKETATGAAAVAKALGLETYMKFLVADAFELELEPHSVDLLWCDFGVGSRMATFALIAWESIRPGGFLVCHSTLTNQGTRDWLEAIRARQAESITGIPPHDYVELSLLEPHKRYQNAVTILQKRKCYEEPVHSLYA